MHSLLVRKQTVRLASRFRAYSEYKPWSNEYSASGTTADTVQQKISSDKTVDPAQELKECMQESKTNGNQDVLEWSAANKTISEIPEGYESLWSSADIDSTPSSCHYQPPRPPRAQISEGLFIKPLKRPVYRRYS